MTHMIPVLSIVTAVALTSLSMAGESNMKTLHDFTVQDITGQDVDLSTYKDKVVLVVNVASKCGFTKQYSGLQSIYETYADRGFVVLGFPANDFGRQEPGSNEEIQQFCTTRFKVTFPMFSKISVKGEDQHPIYAYLTSASEAAGDGGKVSWNFNKFLVGKDGRLIKHFGSRDKPEGETVTQAIEAALAAP